MLCSRGREKEVWTSSEHSGGSPNAGSKYMLFSMYVSAHDSNMMNDPRNQVSRSYLP